jgi:hypothetical protein
MNVAYFLFLVKVHKPNRSLAQPIFLVDGSNDVVWREVIALWDRNITNLRLGIQNPQTTLKLNTKKILQPNENVEKLFNG